MVQDKMIQSVEGKLASYKPAKGLKEFLQQCDEMDLARAKLASEGIPIPEDRFRHAAVRGLPTSQGGEAIKFKAHTEEELS